MTETPDPITQTLKEAPGGRLLDLATGRAIFLEYLLETLHDIELAVGIDSNPQVIKQAHALIAEEGAQPLLAAAGISVTLAQMDTAALGFADASFDTVSIGNSFHHLADLEGTFAEIRRVLRPGGRCIVSEMFQGDQTPAQQTHVLLHHWAAALDRAAGYEHRETYTREELLDLVMQLDLEDLDVFTYAATDEDPHDPETIDHLLTAIDRMIEKVGDVPDLGSLRRRAEALKVRLRDVGYQPATQLIAIGRRGR